MEPSEALVRAERLQHIQTLLYRHPKGLTVLEIAERCSCHARTIQRDLRALQNTLRIGVEDRGGHRYSIRSGYILPTLRLELPQAVALYLAARMLHRRGDLRHPQVLAAMRRLASVLPERLASALEESLGADRPGDSPAAVVFERVSTGWALQRRVVIDYRSQRQESWQRYVIDPYLVEVAGFNQGLYVIAYSHHHGALRTFKLDRIRDAEVLDQEFDRPETRTLWQELQKSWGIVWGDPQRVRLRFASSAARRARESVWHPSQRTRTLADGGCEIEMRLPSLLELLPWLRSWGPEVEVVEPASLRRQVAEDARRLAAQYDSAATHAE